MTRTALRQRREALGYSQEDVAEAVEITRQYFNMIENGERNPNLRLARSIAQFLGGTIEELFFGQSCHDSLRTQASAS